MDTIAFVEAGHSSSGGQRQRIGIAWPCQTSAGMVFDEATSALDTRTEEQYGRGSD